MLEGRLGESRALIIRNAIKNDGAFCGTPEWLDEHGIGVDEYHAFLDYAVEHARMEDFRAENMGVGSIDVEMEFVKHSGKVTDSYETWQVNIPQRHTTDIMRVAQDEVIATLTPRQMSMFSTELVDELTGEIL